MFAWLTFRKVANTLRIHGKERLIFLCVVMDAHSDQSGPWPEWTGIVDRLLAEMSAPP